MARPKKEGLDYFPHDVDSTNDPKLEPAILQYGAAAYAFFFVHLEYCYRSADLSVDVSDSEKGKEMRAVVQRKLRITARQYEEILRTLLRHNAFDVEMFRQYGVLTSNGIKKRAAIVFSRRERAANARVSAAETMSETHDSAAETMSETPQSKAKQSKRKVNYSIENIDTLLCPTSDDDGRAEGKTAKKATKQPPPLPEDSPYYQLAELFITKIREMKPDFKKPNMQVWAKDMRLLVERDKRDIDEVRRVIQWVRDDPFWQVNILSPMKLREQYDRIALKMNKGGGETNGGTHKSKHQLAVEQANREYGHLPCVQKRKEEEEAFFADLDKYL